MAARAGRCAQLVCHDSFGRRPHRQHRSKPALLPPCPLCQGSTPWRRRSTGRKLAQAAPPSARSAPSRGRSRPILPIGRLRPRTSGRPSARAWAARIPGESVSRGPTLSVICDAISITCECSKPSVRMRASGVCASAEGIPTRNQVISQNTPRIMPASGRKLRFLFIYHPQSTWVERTTPQSIPEILS